MIVTFDAGPHTYTHESGYLMPSVTTILDSFKLRPTDFYPADDFYRRRGTAIHRATQLIDDDMLDPVRTAPIILAFAKGYTDFLCDYHPKVLASEEVVCSEDYWYAGMLDREYLWMTGDEVILDIKTSASRNQKPPRATELQTAGYAWARKKPKARRFTLTLSPDGYRLWPEYTNKQDIETWLCFTRAYHWQNPVRTISPTRKAA